MGSILIVYATVEGQTGKIAEYMAERARAQGHRVDLHGTDQPMRGFNLERYNAVLVGGSVYEGGFSPALVSWLREHHDALSALPSAAFAVCLDVLSPVEAEREAAQRYAKDLAEQVDWTPQASWVFAGALRHTAHSWLKRALIAHSRHAVEGDHSEAQHTEYTNWAQVDACLDEFLTSVPEEGPEMLLPGLAEQPKRVLCATDFSDCAQAAVELAAQLARQWGASLQIVHIFHMPSYLEWTGGTGIAPAQVSYVDELRHELMVELESVCRSLEGVEVEPLLLDGEPQLALVELSTEADLLVLGTHGRTGLARLLLGSVAERVVRLAHCPVMTVPVPPGEGSGDTTADDDEDEEPDEASAES